jgi:hypothetical protein
MTYLPTSWWLSYTCSILWLPAGASNHRKAPAMLHLLPKLHSLPDRPVPDVEPASAAASMRINRLGTHKTTVDSPRDASTPVLISEQEVLFNTAVAASVSPATTRRHWPGAALATAIDHIHLRLPEPRPIYPGHEAGYFEGGRMSRMMEHL